LAASGGNHIRLPLSPDKISSRWYQLPRLEVLPAFVRTRAIVRARSSASEGPLVPAADQLAICVHPRPS
jgi:hypothetical protein